MIQALPEFTYKGSLKKGDEAGAKEEDEPEPERCCICLEDFKEDDVVRRLPCLHIFHKDEIDKWLLRNHHCPLCQTSIGKGFEIPDEAKR